MTEWDILNNIAQATSTYHNCVNSFMQQDIYSGQPYESLKRLDSPAAKGAKMGNIVIETLKQRYGMTEQKRLNCDHDVILDGKRTELKCSSCWGSQIGSFKFQQVRPFQDFDRIIFAGFNPDSICWWWATKQDILANVRGNDRLRQHGGGNGQQEIYWITVDLIVPSWLRTDFTQWKSLDD